MKSLLRHRSDRSAPASCANEANGHATLAPISAMNSRRLIVSPVPKPDRLPYVITFPQGGNLGVHVASGSFSDMQNCPGDVCFCANTRHWMRRIYEYTPLSAKVSIDSTAGRSAVSRHRFLQSPPRFWSLATAITYDNIQRGWCLYAMGQRAKGLSLLLEGIEIKRAAGFNLGSPAFLTELAEVYEMAGEPRKGAQSARRSSQVG